MKIHKSTIFLVLMVSFVLGVFVASFLDEVTIFVGCVGIATLILFLVFHRESWGKVVVFSGGIFLFGMLHTHGAFSSVRADTFLDGQQINEVVRVARDVDVRGTHKNVVVEMSHKETKILFRASRYSDLSYGDVVSLQCTLEVPEVFDDFDYRMYLATKGISYVCKKPHYEKVKTHSESFYAELLRFRKKMEENINRVIAQPQAALANGLLFGGDDRLSKNLQDDFARTGMSHIVAVSGYNVTVITHFAILLGIFFGLWRKHAVGVALVSILVFVAMIGFPSSGVRAAIMGTLVLLALHYGRLHNAFGALACAAGAMLFFNPLLLRYDVGFQLSFLATLGMIWIYPLFERFFLQEKKSVSIKEVIFLTLSAQIFVVPIIALHFETFSLVSLLANVSVLLIIPLTMLFSFGASVFGFFVPVLAQMSGWIAYWLLRYEVFVIELFSDFSWASLFVSMPVWMVISYYVVIISIIHFLRKKYAHATLDL